MIMLAIRVLANYAVQALLEMIGTLIIHADEHSFVWATVAHGQLFEDVLREG